MSMENINEKKLNVKNSIKAGALSGGFALSIYVLTSIVGGVGKAISENSKAKEDPDYSIKKTANKFTDALCYIANKEYQHFLGVSTVSNYVGGISSIQFSENAVNYCSYAQKHGEENELLVAITLELEYSTTEECITTIINNHRKVNYVKNVACYDEVRNDRFEIDVLTNAERFGTEYFYKLYKETPEDNQPIISITYKNSDSTLVSYNGIKYPSDASYANNMDPYKLILENDKLVYYVTLNCIPSNN